MVSVFSNNNTRFKTLELVVPQAGFLLHVNASQFLQTLDVHRRLCVLNLGLNADWITDIVIYI